MGEGRSRLVNTMCAAVKLSNQRTGFLWDRLQISPLARSPFRGTLQQYLGKLLDLRNSKDRFLLMVDITFHMFLNMEPLKASVRTLLCLTRLSLFRTLMTSFTGQAEQADGSWAADEKQPCLSHQGPGPEPRISQASSDLWADISHPWFMWLSRSLGLP